MKEQLEALNGITINFGEGGMLIVNIILAFVMFGVALGIKLSTFKEVFTSPKSVIVGVFLQWIGLPAVTFLIALALHRFITPMIALAMLLALEGKHRVVGIDDRHHDCFCAIYHPAELLLLGVAL